MKNAGLYILTALVLGFGACKNTDEALSKEMNSEYETQQGKIKEYTLKNNELAAFGAQLAHVPVALYNDPATNIQTLVNDLNMIINKYQATLGAHNEQVMALSTTIDDYNKGKITGEEARNQLENLKVQFEGLSKTYDRAGEYFDDRSKQYNTILDQWKKANPEEAAAIQSAAPKAGELAPGALSPSASSTLQGSGAKTDDASKQEAKPKN